MAEKQNELKLIRMNEVEAQAINWLWYPYIPFGKIMVIQGKERRAEIDLQCAKTDLFFFM